MPLESPLTWLASRSLPIVAAAALLSGCAASGGLVFSSPQATGTVVVTPSGPPLRPALDIPQGHVPPPGLCRIWVPGVPPGQQSPPGRCEELQYRVPRGAYLVRG